MIVYATRERVSKWITGFFAYVQENKPEYLQSYFGRILFSPSMTKPGVIYAGFAPAIEENSSVEEKEQLEAMWMFFEEYYRENPV